MTLACEGSATQALDPTRCGSFDFARKLASLRMTLSLRRIRDPSARRHEWRIRRLRSQARFAQDDTALRNRGRPGPGLAGVAKREASYGPKSGPKAGSRASSPGEQAAACDYIRKLVSWAKPAEWGKLTLRCAQSEPSDQVALEGQ